MIKSILFDMDDVICAYDFDKRMTLLAQSLGVDAGKIRSEIFESGLEARADSGVYTASQYLEEISSRLGVAVDRDTWVAIRAATTRPTPAMLDLARTLGERYDLALLTDNGWLMAETLPHMLPRVVDVFGSNVFVSAQVGASKLSPRAFTTLLEMLGWVPEETLYIDDFKAYIKSAHSVGLQTHQFDGIEGLEQKLRELNML